MNVSAATRASNGSVPGDEMVLVGRKDELASLQALLDDLAAGGASLVIHGDPGIGKSALVDEFGRLARGRGVSMVRRVGVPAEQAMAFAGLHRLLRPYLAHADSLPEPQREALDAAFGRSGAVTNDVFLVALAALERHCCFGEKDASVTVCSPPNQMASVSSADAVAIGHRGSTSVASS